VTEEYIWTLKVTQLVADGRSVLVSAIWILCSCSCGFNQTYGFNLHIFCCLLTSCYVHVFIIKPMSFIYIFFLAFSKVCD
jgi:hypothetical protein